MKYRVSAVYKRRGKQFRYRYDDCIVEYGFMENGEWQYLEGVGLRPENWRNKEARDEYLDEWIDELDEEFACMVSDFIRFELPHFNKV